MDSPDQPTTTTQKVESTNIPAYLQGPAMELAGRAQGIAARPYEPYQGQRVAGFNTDQDQALSMVRALPGQSQPYIDAANQNYGLAQSRIAAAPTKFGQAEADHYMNPYTKNVIDATQGRAQDDFARQQNDLNAAKIKNGTWGSSRYAIQAGLGQDLFNKTMMEQRYKGLADAYDKSYNMFSGDRNAMLQEGQAFAGLGGQYANLGGQVNQLGLANANALSGQGDKRQAVQQVGLDTAHSDFTNQRDWEKNQTDWLSSILHGYQGSTSTTSTSQPSNSLQSALGIGLAGLGAIKSV